MADKEIRFVLDLDAKDFLEQGLQAKGVIEGLGSEENLSGLLEGLAQTGAALGSVGIAVYAFKKALDLTVEGEQLQRIENQFNTLAETAGLAPEELKSGLEEASKGLIDTSDLLEIANKKIVAMGEDAGKLPDIMELSRKATAVFGGDLTSNFDNISTAIANGNARMLKHYGIVIDTNKAIQDYAKANNIAQNEISAAGQRQALLNAALEQGQKAFKGVDTDLGSATNTLQLLKVTLKDIGETFTLAFEKIMGPTVRNFLTSVKDMASQAKLYMKSAFGEGAEQNEAQITLLEQKIKSLGKTIEDLRAKQGTKFDFAPGDTLSRLQAANTLMQQSQAQLANLKKARADLTGEEVKGAQRTAALGQKALSDSKINLEARKQNQTKFEQEMIAIRQKYLKAWQGNITSLDQIEKVMNAQKEGRENDHQLKIQQIRNSTHLNTIQKDQLLAAEEEAYQKQVQADELQTSKIRKQLLDNYVQNSTNAFDGIGRAFRSHVEQAKDDLSDFGKRGEEVFKSFQDHSVYAFEQMGQAMAQGKDIASSVGDAMKSVFLNVIADRAIAEGSLLLLTGLWPPNPVSLAAGAGLIALGGALRTLAGGSGATAAGGVGGGLGVSGGYGIATQPQTSASGVSQTEQTSVIQAQQEYAATQGTEDASSENSSSTSGSLVNSTVLSHADLSSPVSALESSPSSPSGALADATPPPVADFSTATQDTAHPDMTQMQQAPQKTVHVNIAGNLFNTSETQRTLMEMIRQETDATDFTYNKIGV